MMEERKPKYAIGQTFTRKGKGWKREYTVTDIYTTRNLEGDLIKFEYLTTHDFLGQSLKELVIETTIAIALWDAGIRPEVTA
jgi:hypothetical protein